MAQNYNILMHLDFVDKLSSLPQDIKSKAIKVMKLLVSDFRHPGLQTKRVKSSVLGVYECRVDNDYRLIYDCERGSIRCWYIGHHDIALKFAERVSSIPVDLCIEDIDPIDIDAGLYDLIVYIRTEDDSAVEWQGDIGKLLCL